MGKSIVIYYSRAGQNYVNGDIVSLARGNTEIVAEKIHNITGADIFRVEPVHDYPADYYECTDVAKRELNDNARPAVRAMPGNLSEYDTVFIGGPVWWGTFPMPMFTALAGVDWAGKTVMPFCTHEGSGLGDIMRDMRRMCAGANVGAGLAIVGSHAGDCDAQIERWVKK